MFNILSFSLIIFIFSILHAFSDDDDEITADEEAEARQVIKWCEEKVKTKGEYFLPYQGITDGPDQNITSARGGITAKGVALLKLLNLPDYGGDLFKAVEETVKKRESLDILKKNQFLSYLLWRRINRNFDNDNLPRYDYFNQASVNNHLIDPENCFGVFHEFPEKYLFYESTTLNAKDRIVEYNPCEHEGFGCTENGYQITELVFREQVVNTPYLRILDTGDRMKEKMNKRDVTNFLSILYSKDTPDEKLVQITHLFPKEETVSIFNAAQKKLGTDK